MKDVHLIAADTYWLGGSDRRLALFENLFPIPRGVSYNSYLILDEKALLLDTVDSSVAQSWLENLTALLAGRPLDYLVISHMEPDHCAQIARLTALWPDLKLVVNAEELPHAAAVLRHRLARPAGGRGRGQHPEHRPPHPALCHGPHGALARGDGEL